MSKEGHLLNDFDPKPAVQKNAENARDWEYSEEARYLYGMAVLFKDRFLDPILLTDRGRLPDPVISFEDLRNKKILAGYRLHRNPQGLLDEIAFNTAHYAKSEDGKKEWKYGRWAQAETLLHEQVHLWQENFGQSKHRPGRVMHDKEFVAKCESLGLHPMPVVGCHIQVADGVFAQLMDELGIPRPSDISPEETTESTKTGGVKKDWFDPGKEKGRSTLTKYTCGCGEHVRVGKKDWPGAICKACGTEYVKGDGLNHTLYSAGDSEEGSKNPVRKCDLCGDRLCTDFSRGTRAVFLDSGRVFLDFTSEVEGCPIRADLLDRMDEQEEGRKEAFPPPEDADPGNPYEWDDEF